MAKMDNAQHKIDVVQTSVHSEQLISIGSSEQLLPEELLHDDQITGDELRLWSILRNLATLSAQDMPTQDELATMINKSRPTTNSGLQMLRVNRWITVIQEEERNQRGQFNQLVYAIHNFQMPIHETVRLDPGYAMFLEEKSKGASKRLRQRAIDTIAELRTLPKDELHQNSAQMIINHGGGGLIIENSPCKDFLHGKHLSSSTSTSSSLVISSESDISLNIDENTSNLSNTGVNGDVNGCYVEGNETVQTLDTPEQHQTVQTLDTLDHPLAVQTLDSPWNETESDDTDLLGPVIPPITENKPNGAEDPPAKPDTVQWHRHMDVLPVSLKPIILKLVQKYNLKADQIDLALKVTLRRIENPKLKPIDVLPKYVEKVFAKAQQGELYDSDAAKRQTADRRNRKKEQAVDSALKRRAEAVGLQREPGEPDDDFVKRVQDEEYIKQMERLGQKVDRKTKQILPGKP